MNYKTTLEHSQDIQLEEVKHPGQFPRVTAGVKTDDSWLEDCKKRLRVPLWQLKNRL